jgi:hypothetical protein
MLNLFFIIGKILEESHRCQLNLEMAYLFASTPAQK